MESFQLSIEPCPYGCDYCENDSYQQCRRWSLQYWDQYTNTFWNNDYNLYQLYNCNLICQYTLKLPAHNKVMIRFRLLLPKSQTLNFNILIDTQIYASKSQLSPLSLVQFFEFTVPFFYHIDNTINIQIQQTGGQFDLNIKDFQLLIQKEDEQHYFVPGCESLIKDYCWECESGWIFMNEHQFHSNQGQQLGLFEQQCIPYCGDKLIVGSEQCDDGNDTPYDGCCKCQYQCSMNCVQCIFGICQQCDIGYSLNGSFICQSICGDGIIIPYLEQCDDQNYESDDGCYECQFECFQNEKQVMCTQCSLGYQFYHNECFPICGDSIVLLDYEQCDDGNDEQYDGCFECEYQCNQNCQICKQGICQDQCNYGEVAINQLCLSICGNLIVTGQEVCDDGNNIQYDGCYQCQYSCPLNCLYCDSGLCQECEVGFELIQQICQSIAICGDGYLGKQEECDDGNLYSNDGCHQCVVEENWYCNLDQPSSCFFSISPFMIINYLNNTSQTQYVQLQFSMEVFKYNSNQSIMQISIPSINAELYEINVYPIIEIQSNLTNPEYVISVDIFQQLNTKPYLEIDFNSQVFNEYFLKLLNPKVQIQLQITQYLNPTQKTRSEQLASTNEKILYGLGAISFLSFLMGDTAVFQEILRLLQYQSYLKYINVDYPQNLYIFFQSTNIVSVSSILKYTNLNYYLNKYSLKQGPLNSNGKFALYKYDADLITNLSCQIIQFIGLVSLAFIIKLIQMYFYEQKTTLKYIDWMNNLTNKCSSQSVFTFNNIFYSIIKGVLNGSKMYARQGLRVIFVVNSQDLIFKAFLYLHSTKCNTIRDYLQIAISLIIVASYIFMIFITLSNKDLFLQSTQQEKLQKQIDLITMTRSLIFLGLLVFWQSNQIQQTILISLINALYLIVLKSTKNKLIYYNFIQQIVEGLVILFTLSTFFYFNDLKSYFNEEQKILIGWCHIGLLLLTLLAEASKFIVAKGKVLFDFIKKKMEEAKIKKQASTRSIFM